MTTHELARRAIRIYPRHILADRQQTKHLRREWIRAVRLLGDKWILSQPKRST